MAHVYQGERTFLSRVVSPIERFIYRIGGIHPEEEMTWKIYAVALARFQLFWNLIVVWLTQVTKPFAVEPCWNEKYAFTYCIQHGNQFCHEHELAKLRG